MRHIDVRSWHAHVVFCQEIYSSQHVVERTAPLGQRLHSENKQIFWLFLLLELIGLDFDIAFLNNLFSGYDCCLT